MSDDAVVIIGAGPAGLIAADVLSAAGARVLMYERMPSVARKFLMAGRGGLNLTHSEPFEPFVARYGEASAHLRPMLEAFTPRDLIAWCEGLGQPTFVGSSGRVFPKAMKASPLLRALLSRLATQGVILRTRMTWTGFAPDGALAFANGETIKPAATLLALGGASWPRLGADGSWVTTLAERGVEIAPLRPANMGFNVAWSDHLRARFAGAPLKGVAITHGARSSRGDAIITAYGIEGGAIYALSQALRDTAPATISINLRPDLNRHDIAARLAKAKPSDTISSALRKALELPPHAIALLYEAGQPPRDPSQLAAHIKAVPIKLDSPRSLDRAISTAGGVSWRAIDADLQLHTRPRMYVAGEMLDWEAPTGGYLLQASFATGVWAARAMLRRLDADR